MPTIEEQRQRIADIDNRMQQNQSTLRTTAAQRQPQPMFNQQPRTSRGMSIDQTQGGGWQPIDPARQQLLAQQQQLERDRASAQAQLEALQSREQALQLTQGRAEEIMQDPYFTGALEELQGMRGPVTDEVRGAMQGAVADAGAIAAQRQLESLRSQAASLGMSPTDPGFQAAMRDVEGQRMAQNQASQRQALLDQASQNYAARERALGLLGQMRGQQYGLSAAPAAQAANFYASDTREDPGNAQSVMPIQQPVPQIGNAMDQIRMLRQIAGGM